MVQQSTKIEDLFLQQANVCRSKFVAKVDPFSVTFAKVHRGALISESFAFCVMCELFHVKYILESGIYNGQSTSVFARYFMHDDIIVHSLDIVIRQDMLKRLQRYLSDSIIIENAQSQLRLPELIGLYDKGKIGVIIDGPKGIAALQLAMKCIEQYNVAFVAIHDVYADINGYRKNWFVNLDKKYATFFTDNAYFIQQFRDLDGFDTEWKANFDENGNGFLPYQKWSKHRFCEDIQSYGPTLGFIFRENDIG